MKIQLFALLTALLFLNGAAFAANSSANYDLTAQVFSSGSGAGSSVSYQVSSIERHYLPKIPTSTSFVIGEGFLNTVSFAQVIFAPIVTSIDPSSAKSGQSISLTITGANFLTGAAVKLSMSVEADVTASNIKVLTTGKITCDLNLTNLKSGLWNITVTNTDGRAGTLPTALNITYNAPTINSITPSTAHNDGPVIISNLSGSNFRPAATVKLTMAGASDIPAVNIVVESSNVIRCSFDLLNRSVGYWNVMVTNDDGQSVTLSAGFKVDSPTLQAVEPVQSAKNPFNPTTGPTTIKYKLSQDADITVYIFNIRGERVWEYHAPSGSSGGKSGTNEIMWDGISSFRSVAGIGVYFVHVTANVNGTITTLSKTKVAIVR